MTSNLIKRHGLDADASTGKPLQVGPGMGEQQGYYDDRGNYYLVVDQQKSSHVYNHGPGMANGYAPPGWGTASQPHNYYQWWGGSWRIGTFWMWFWGLIILAMLAVGAVGFGFALSNNNKIHTLESNVMALTTTVSSQTDALNQLTTPFAHTASGSLVTTNAKQTLNCGGAACVMTLPNDLSSYAGLPEVCVVSAEAQAHTVTVAASAFFQPGDNAVATFAGADVGESFCFIATSSTTSAVTSANGVTFA